jgi:hypothetical protein
VRITNVTSRDIAVDQIEVSCHCVSVAPTSFIIGPKQTVSVSVTLNLDSSTPDLVRGDVPFEARLRPRLRNERQGAIEWRLKGVQVPAGHAQPSCLRFGQIGIDEIAPQRSCEVMLTDSTNSVTLIEKPDWLDAELIRPDQTRGQWRVTATVKPVSTPRGLHGDLRLKVTTKEHAGNGTIIVPCSGEVVGDICVEPDYILFGPMLPSATAKARLMVRTRSGRPINSIVSKTSSSDVTVELLESSPASRSYNITYTSATEPGILQRTVEFEACDEDNQKFVIIARAIASIVPAEMVRP